ncbi:hypothetical protein KSP40_PGU007977 [Platanthera guangdongensis]|uniref:AIR9-like A9 domain-containing protein n=1 Tax=Platanthera guangdongensis TaxID=2320717 RepID=A0ABR2LW08_9ASPA
MASRGGAMVGKSCAGRLGGLAADGWIRQRLHWSENRPRVKWGLGLNSLTTWKSTNMGLNERSSNLSPKELEVAKLYPSHTSSCIRDGWQFGRPELAAGTLFHSTKTRFRRGTMWDFSIPLTFKKESSPRRLHEIDTADEITGMKEEALQTFNNEKYCNPKHYLYYIKLEKHTLQILRHEFLEMKAHKNGSAHPWNDAKLIHFAIVFVDDKKCSHIGIYPNSWRSGSCSVADYLWRFDQETSKLWWYEASLSEAAYCYLSPADACVEDYSTFSFLVDKWREHLPPGFMVKEASVDHPFEEDICLCHFNFVNLNNDSELVLKYQWFLGESTPTKFEAIADAVGEAYWPRHDDIGKFLKVECTPILKETEYPAIFAISVPVSPGTGYPKVLNLSTHGELVEGNLIRGSAEIAWCGGTPAKGVASFDILSCLEVHRIFHCSKSKKIHHNNCSEVSAGGRHRGWGIDNMASLFSEEEAGGSDAGEIVSDVSRILDLEIKWSRWMKKKVFPLTQQVKETCKALYSELQPIKLQPATRIRQLKDGREERRSKWREFRFSPSCRPNAVRLGRTVILIRIAFGVPFSKTLIINIHGFCYLPIRNSYLRSIAKARFLPALRSFVLIPYLDREPFFLPAGELPLHVPFLHASPLRLHPHHRNPKPSSSKPSSSFHNPLLKIAS